MKLLTVNDLSLQNEGYFAFKHVAFSLSQNELIGINGDNGSGKTQLLEAIADHRRPDSGKIEYTPGVRIGYLPQIDPQIADQKVSKYLEDVRRLSGDLAVRQEQLQGMITFLGMSPYLDRNIQQLSLGLKQKVDFLAAVAGHPNVLLLDEPFSFQSYKSTLNMMSLIKDLKDNGSGILMAGTQLSNEVKENFDTEYLLKDNALTKVVKERKIATHCLLIFSVNPNSMAITKELNQYISANVNNLIEMKVPATLKDSLTKKMVALNYKFEEVQNIED